MANTNLWTQINMTTHELPTEILLAYVEHLPFNSFEEEDNQLIGYMRTDDVTEEIKEALQACVANYNVTIDYVDLPDENWNKTWESHFPIVEIDNICTIIAPFHDKPQIANHTITIHPKMAFGTGHHNTTAGMIKMLNTMDLADKNILDFGSGTGVLAIFASMKGAKKLDAIDIEAPAYDSMVENFELNHITNITPIHGDKSDIPTGVTYDVILANITANVIIDCIDSLSNVLVQNGAILFSGFFISDLDKITEAAKAVNLIYDCHDIHGDWVVAKFSKQ